MREEREIVIILNPIKDKQNLKVIEEISDIIYVKRNWKFKKLTPEEIIKTYEFEQFYKKYPEICKLAGIIKFTKR